jgi:hypothetical protein
VFVNPCPIFLVSMLPSVAFIAFWKIVWFFRTILSLVRSYSFFLLCTGLCAWGLLNQWDDNQSRPIWLSVLVSVFNHLILVIGYWVGTWVDRLIVTVGTRVAVKFNDIQKTLILALLNFLIIFFSVWWFWNYSLFFLLHVCKCYSFTLALCDLWLYLFLLRSVCWSRQVQISC